MHVCRCCGSESEETGHQSEGVIESTVGEEKLGVPPMIEGERMRKRQRTSKRVHALPAVILFKMQSTQNIDVSSPPSPLNSLSALCAVCCSNQKEELFCAAVWMWSPF